jgi:hypothetical protein
MCCENIHLDRPLLNQFRIKLDRFFDYLPGISLLNNAVNAIQLRRFKGKEDVSLFQQYLRHKTVKHCALYMFPLAKVIHNIWKKAKGIESERFDLPVDQQQPPALAPTPPMLTTLRSQQSESDSIDRLYEWEVQSSESESPPQRMQTTAYVSVPYDPYNQESRFQLPTGLLSQEWPINEWTRTAPQPAPKPVEAPIESPAPKFVTMMQEIEEETIKAKFKGIQGSIEYAQKKWELMMRFHELLLPLHTAMQSPETFYKNPQDASAERNQAVFNLLKNPVQKFVMGSNECVPLIQHIELRVNSVSTLAELEAERARIDPLTEPVHDHFHLIEGIYSAIITVVDPALQAWKNNLKDDVQVLIGQYLLRYKTTIEERAAVKYKT